MIKCFGVATSYLIIVGDLAPPALSFFGLRQLHRWEVILFAFGVAGSLTCCKNLSGLRFTAAGSVVIVAWTIVLIVLFVFQPSEAFEPCGHPGHLEDYGTSAEEAPKKKRKVAKRVVEVKPSFARIFKGGPQREKSDLPVQEDEGLQEIPGETENKTQESDAGVSWLSSLVQEQPKAEVDWLSSLKAPKAKPKEVPKTMPERRKRRDVQSDGQALPIPPFWRVATAEELEEQLVNLRGTMLPRRTSSDALPVFIFGFTCQQNIFSVCNEVRNTTPQRMNGIITGAYCISFVALSSAAIFGYLTFGPQLKSDNAVVAFTSLLYSMLAVFSYPLQIHPSRASALALMNLVRPSEGAHRWAAVTLLELVGSLLIAITVMDLGKILGVVGATGSTMVSYILPGIVYVQTFRDFHLRRSLALGQLILGCIIMPVCLVLLFL
eukprot:g361.t1